MLVEYMINKDYYVVDELDLGGYEFIVRDVYLSKKPTEQLVYNTATRRIQAVEIPDGFVWKGAELGKTEEQLEAERQAQLYKYERQYFADLQKAVFARVAFESNWLDSTEYNNEKVSEWLTYLKNKSKGVILHDGIPPIRPDILKRF
jgi:hypothetical protein